MEKIEIKLNEAERRALRELALTTGKTEGQLIHDEIEELIRRRQIQHMERLSDHSGMMQARGIWKDRDDLPDRKTSARMG